jgi:hypothetical protein
MIAVDDAIILYGLVREWPIFPVARTTQPLTSHGYCDASIDPDVIAECWRRWPDALIGSPTGANFVVLDVDVKHPGPTGFDTLACLGVGILPDTPMSHTPSGGVHLYFCPGQHDIPNTQGAVGRGIGPGLDWRRAGGSIILPSPDSVIAGIRTAIWTPCRSPRCLSGYCRSHWSRAPLFRWSGPPG